jgi:predicted RNA-binding Zn-ribbon protein involved in translation (DUF1610 family)
MVGSSFSPTERTGKLTLCPVCGAALIKAETQKVRYYACETCGIVAGISKNVLNPDRDAERILRGENVPAD